MFARCYKVSATVQRNELAECYERAPNNGMHLTALRAAGDAGGVERNRYAVEPTSIPFS